jgi:hypothetical protein
MPNDHAPMLAQPSCALCAQWVSSCWLHKPCNCHKKFAMLCLLCHCLLLAAPQGVDGGTQHDQRCETKRPVVATARYVAAFAPAAASASVFLVLVCQLRFAVLPHSNFGTVVLLAGNSDANPTILNLGLACTPQYVTSYTFCLTMLHTIE